MAFSVYSLKTGSKQDLHVIHRKRERSVSVLYKLASTKNMLIIMMTYLSLHQMPIYFQVSLSSIQEMYLDKASLKKK